MTSNEIEELAKDFRTKVKPRIKTLHETIEAAKTLALFEIAINLAKFAERRAS